MRNEKDQKALPVLMLYGAIAPSVFTYIAEGYLLGFGLFSGLLLVILVYLGYAADENFSFEAKSDSALSLKKAAKITWLVGLFVAGIQYQFGREEPMSWFEKAHYETELTGLIMPQGDSNYHKVKVIVEARSGKYYPIQTKLGNQIIDINADSETCNGEIGTLMELDGSGISWELYLQKELK